MRRRDRWKPSLYLKDLTSGNVKLHEFIRYGLLAIFNHLTGTLFGRRYPHVCGRAGDKTPNAQLNLRPGELVQVRSKDDIMRTLNSQQKNRGLWFDVEMLPYCEKEIPVLHRVEKIVDERTGRMIKLPNSCVILDGAACGGKLSPNRMFCPRSIYPFWREVWLERVNDKPGDTG